MLTEDCHVISDGTYFADDPNFRISDLNFVQTGINPNSEDRSLVARRLDPKFVPKGPKDRDRNFPAAKSDAVRETADAAYDCTYKANRGIMSTSDSYTIVV